MMKKIIYIIMIVACTGCATALRGAKTDCQRTKPLKGEPARKISVGYLIIDAVIFPPFLIVDFVTGSIYKPCKEQTN